jgi:DNA topoisomerase-1
LSRFVQQRVSRSSRRIWRERQLATAVWVIDRLALRVGGEKDTDEEADTVGCCSLRVRTHAFRSQPRRCATIMRLNWSSLGKDSMLYKQTIDFSSAIYNENNGMGKAGMGKLQAIL